MRPWLAPRVLATRVSVARRCARSCLRTSAAGGGRWLPGIVVVALGEPAAPAVSCAVAAEVSAVAARRARVRASKFAFMGNLPTLVATHLACPEHSPHQRRFDETAAREIYPSELTDARRITYSLGDLVRSNFSRSSLPGQFCLHVATWTLVAALSESTCKRTPCKHQRGGAWKPLRVSTDRETLKDSMRPFRLGFQKSRG